MRLIIKSADKSLFLLLETKQYQEVWKKNSRAVLKAFRKLSGLEFQQQGITAIVSHTRCSTSGGYYRPMRLAGDDNRPEEFKLLTIIHELTHRLLHGNGLGVVNLGLVPEGDETDFREEMSHRHAYLLIYDVVIGALGEGWDHLCYQYEVERHGGKLTDQAPHSKAWQWAMNMSFDERQQAVKKLTSKAITRENWSSKKITPLDAEAWFEYLKPI